MFQLKKKVRNKACVEGSIAEAYLIEEISAFCSHYFEEGFQSQLNHVPWNDDGGEVASEGRLSIFSHRGHAFGELSCRWLTDKEYDQAVIYTLLNCEEVVP